MLDTKTSALVLALLGVIVYESTSNSSHRAQMQKQIDMQEAKMEMQQLRLKLLSEAQSATHDSVMLETSNRREAIRQLNDPAVALNSQIDLWDRPSQWVVYMSSSFEIDCKEYKFTNKDEAYAKYKQIPAGDSKIIWHDNGVVERSANATWTDRCAKTAKINHDIADLEHSKKDVYGLLDKQSGAMKSEKSLVANYGRDIKKDAQDIISLRKADQEAYRSLLLKHARNSSWQDSQEKWNKIQSNGLLQTAAVASDFDLDQHKNNAELATAKHEIAVLKNQMTKVNASLKAQEKEIKFFVSNSNHHFESLLKQGKEIKKNSAELRHRTQEIDTDEWDIQTNSDDLKKDDKRIKTNSDDLDEDDKRIKADSNELKEHGQDIKIDQKAIKVMLKQ